MDRHEQAARLFGAAEAFAASIGASFEPVLPEVFDQGIAATRDAMGADAYAIHHAAGAALSFEDALAEALAVTVDLAPGATTPSCTKG